MSLMKYDGDYVTQRKNMHKFIGTNDAILKLHPQQELETTRFAARIIADEGKALYDHIRMYVFPLFPVLFHLNLLCVLWTRI